MSTRGAASDSSAVTTSTRLRAVFFGTPAFAIPSLRSIHRETDLLAIITQPDRPKGRGRLIAAPAVAQVGRELGARVLQPARVKDPSVLETLRALRPDVGITVAYGKIIPREILRLPPLGCINVHPSLLPKYRGASPIQAALAAGESETGVTIMYQSEELDAGDIILQRRVPIALDDTAATLEATLARAGAEALVDALRLIAHGTAPRIPQDPAAASYVRKLTKDHGRIDWSKPAEDLARLIRAMNPWPSAYTRHRGKLLKIWKAGPAGADGEAGVVCEVRRGEGFVVGTGSGALLVLEVQPEGGRRMTADEYVRGYRLEVGERLGQKIDGSAGARERDK